MPRPLRTESAAGRGGARQLVGALTALSGGEALLPGRAWSMAPLDATSLQLDTEEDTTPDRSDPTSLRGATPDSLRLDLRALGNAYAALTLTASGRPSIPAPNFALALTGGPANGPHAFSIALARAAAPIPLGSGCFLLIDPATVLAGPAGNASRTLGLPIPNDAGLSGLVLAIQGVAADLGTGRLATSNGLELRFGS